MYDVFIIGSGVSGGFTALELSKYNLKESDVMSFRSYLDKKAEEGKTSVEDYIAGTKKNTQTA